jgi:hypothetical protein
MKARFAVFFLLLMSAVVYAQQASNAAYPLKIHVVSSEVSANCATMARGFNCGVLGVTIDGKKYRLEGSCGLANVLRTGDYPGRIVKDNAAGAAEYKREYELLFADGKTEKYWVIGESE